VAVNTSSVGEEEVKYTVDDQGWIAQLSKVVQDGLGEAVGLNYVSAADKDALMARLDEVDDQDYFERGIELAIERDGLRWAALDISGLSAVEVDTPEDLAVANERLVDETGPAR
jgi:choline kinase